MQPCPLDTDEWTNIAPQFVQVGLKKQLTLFFAKTPAVDTFAIAAKRLPFYASALSVTFALYRAGDRHQPPAPSGLRRLRLRPRQSKGSWRASLSPPTQSQHIEDEFSPEQLVGIGAVVLACNRAEHAVDLLLSLGLGLSPELASVVPSRIGRLEDKIEIVELAAKTLGLPREAQTLLSASLVEEPGLSILKRYRDAIARASEPNDEQGKQKTVVLFKAASLQACVKHLEVLTDELRCLVNIFDLARRSISRPTDTHKPALAAAIRDELSSTAVQKLSAGGAQVTSKTSRKIQATIGAVDRLRGPNGCAAPFAVSGHTREPRSDYDAYAAT